MEKDPYLLLQALYPTMHRVEKKIASYVLQNTEQVMGMSIQRLASELDIAESSIVRFSKILGCSGFSDLKLKLAKFAPSPTKTIFEELNTKDNAETITKKVFSCNMDTLERTLDQIDYEKVAQAIDWMDEAKRIVLYGVGASASIAEDFYIRLMRVGISAAAVTDSHQILISSGMLAPEDLAIGISHTGRSIEVVSALKLAKNQGAKTISITGHPKTPIKKVSDLCLELYTPPQLFISPRVAQISMIDSLYVGLAIRHKSSAISSVERMNASLDIFKIK